MSYKIWTSAQELAEFCREFRSGDKYPVLSDMISAVRASSLKKDLASFEELLDALIEFNVILDKPKDIAIRDGRESLATLAFLADHNRYLTSEQWRSFDPAEAYRQPHQHGPAMTLVKKICDNRQIDLDALYREFSK